MRVVTIALCALLLSAGYVGISGIPGEFVESETETVEADPTPQHPTTPSAARYDVDVEGIEDHIHKKMNNRRKESNRESLARNKTLDSIARYKSWDMAQNDYFGHRGVNGTTHSHLRERFGSKCDYSGQNLYNSEWASDSPNTHLSLTKTNKMADAAVRVLFNSPGHRENALSPHYDSQGIGVFVDENGTVFVTQEFCG